MRFSDLQQPAHTPVPGHPGVFVRHGTVAEHEALSNLLADQELVKDKTPNELDKELLAHLLKVYIRTEDDNPFETDAALSDVHDTITSAVLKVLRDRRRGNV